MIKIYRKTATIKAEQFDGSNDMINKYHIKFNGVYGFLFRIETMQGWIGLAVGDWIVTGANDEYWTIANDVFKKEYAELPVIPNYVAEYINYMKSSYCNIWDAMHYLLRSNDISEYMEYNLETFVRAWVDGYQVEAEHDTRTA